MPPRELKKFHDLHILDIAAGIEHILLFAVSKTSIYTSVDISSSDPNENVSAKESPVQAKIIPKPSAPPASPFGEETNGEPNGKSPHEIKIPVLETKTLQSIYSTEEENTSAPKKGDEKINDATGPLSSGERRPSEELNVPIESNESLNGIAKMEKAIGSIGESITSDVKSIVDSGKTQITEIKDGVVKNVAEIPKNVVDYAKNEIAPQINDQVKRLDDKKNEVIEGISTEVDSLSKNLFKFKSEKKLSLDSLEESKEEVAGTVSQIDKTKEFLRDNQNEMQELLRSDRIKQELEKDEKIEVLVDVDEKKVPKMGEKVKFIDNGRDVSDANDIIESMKEEIKEMEAEDEDEDKMMDLKEMTSDKKTPNDAMGAALGQAFAETMPKTRLGN